MANRRKGMVYYTAWIEREESEKLIELLSEDIKSDGDLKLIGDIISRVNAIGDLK